MKVLTVLLILQATVKTDSIHQVECAQPRSSLLNNFLKFMGSRIIGIGTDILHVPRIRDLIQRRGDNVLAHRILSDSERRFWGSLTSAADRERYLSVR